MQYRTIPKNGDRLSALGFGCMWLPMVDGKIEEVRAIDQIRRSIDDGINYIDTAWPYHNGQSEPVPGNASEDGYRELGKIATKLPTWLIKSREDMDVFLNAQLERLDTDHIDYYRDPPPLRSLLGDDQSALGVIDFFDKAREDGHIVNPGFSLHGLQEDFQPIVEPIHGSTARFSTTCSTPIFRQEPRGVICCFPRFGRGDHGTLAGRQPRIAHTATGYCRHLGPCRNKAHPGGKGPALDMESPGGHGGALGHE